MRVEAGRKQDQVGVEAAGHRGQDALKSFQVAFVADVGGEGHIDCRPAGFIRPQLGGSPGSWVVRKLMGAKKKHAGVFEKDVLGPVAVVHIEVDDQDPLDSVLALCPTGGDGCVGKETKAHALLRDGVVPGRAHQRKTVVDLFPQHSIDQVEQPPSGAQGCLVAVGVDVGVRVEQAAAAACDRAQPLHVLGRVYRQNGVEGGWCAGHLGQLVQHPFFCQQFQRPLQTAKIFRMAFERMAKVVGVVDDCGSAHRSAQHSDWVNAHPGSVRP